MTNPEKLLKLLKATPGKVISLKKIWEAVWECQYDGSRSTRVSIYVAIHAARWKLKGGEIRTVRGEGYVYVSS
jgi:DNA-binding response OmpR family regulator